MVLTKHVKDPHNGLLFILNKFAERGDIEGVKFLIETFKLDVNEPDRAGWTPLASVVSKVDYMEPKDPGFDRQSKTIPSFATQVLAKLIALANYLINELNASVHFTIEHLPEKTRKKHKNNSKTFSLNCV